MRYSNHIGVGFQQAVKIIAKRWTALIIKVLMDSPLRFNELADRLSVVSDRVLSERLKELEQERIVERRVSIEPPIRVEYSLTDKGRALSPIIAAIDHWSHAWIFVETQPGKDADHELPVTTVAEPEG
jgi:DNA-binding HxlR family transcriptional regulator